MDDFEWTDDALALVTRAGKLKAPHVAKMSLVSRRWNAAMGLADIWASLAMTRFPEYQLSSSTGDTEHPRDFYRKRHFEDLLNSWLPNLRWVLGYADSLDVGTVCGIDRSWQQHSNALSAHTADLESQHEAELAAREFAAQVAHTSPPPHLRPHISTNPLCGLKCEEAFLLFHVMSSSSPGNDCPPSGAAGGAQGVPWASSHSAAMRAAGKSWACPHVVVNGVKYFVLFSDGMCLAGISRGGAQIVCALCAKALLVFASEPREGRQEGSRAGPGGGHEDRGGEGQGEGGAAGEEPLGGLWGAWGDHQDPATWIQEDSGGGRDEIRDRGRGGGESAGGPELPPEAGAGRRVAGEGIEVEAVGSEGRAVAAPPPLIASAIPPVGVREGTRRRILEADHRLGGSYVAPTAPGPLAGIDSHEAVDAGHAVGAAGHGQLPSCASGGEPNASSRIDEERRPQSWSIFGRMVEQAEARASAAAAGGAAIQEQAGRGRGHRSDGDRHQVAQGRAADVPFRAPVPETMDMSPHEALSSEPGGDGHGVDATLAGTSTAVALESAAAADHRLGRPHVEERQVGAVGSIFDAMLRAAEDKAAAASTASAAARSQSRGARGAFADLNDFAPVSDAWLSPPPTPPPFPEGGGPGGYESEEAFRSYESEEAFLPLPITRWKMEMGKWCSLEEWAQHRLARGRALRRVGRLNDSLVSVYCLARYLAVAGL